MNRILSDHSRLFAEAVPYLLQWFDYNKRILPWRSDPTPYHVFVSEIMLQQTRVEAVKAYYERFLEALPNLSALAEAKEEQLLKLWEGLGYYSRVRNLQKAAQKAVIEYDGRLPADYEKLKTLPGIGDYTAGAIASIAFGLPYPAVDGNVLRVMSRLACDESDISSEQTKTKLKEELLSIMPERSGDFNQSLMELGATVCIPNGKPLCDTCPVMHLCRAFHEGRETELPRKAAKKERRIEERNIFLVFSGNKLLLHKRGKKGLLAGLWELPGEELSQDTGLKQDRKKEQKETKVDGFISRLQKGYGKELLFVKQEKAKHVFSHVEWHMTGFFLELTETDEKTENNLLHFLIEETGEEWVFADKKEVEERYSIPSAFAAFLKKSRNEEMK